MRDTSVGPCAVMDGSVLALAGAGSPPLLLSVDFEDWHQLVRRRLGVSGWEEPGPALARQTQTLLELLDELGVKATFFVLGITAQAHPELVEEVVRGGHEIACHGHGHRLVRSQSRQEFAEDLGQARQVIAELTGQLPIGYRAPAFSITAECPWAHEVLVEQGFAYDASEHDSPVAGQRVLRENHGPRAIRVAGRTLWELPVAVWRGRIGRLPVGGASYWAVLPSRVILRGLSKVSPLAGLYLHPQELDPEPLDAALPPGTRLSTRLRGAGRSAQRNLARRRAAEVLRAIAGQHQLITYGEAHARLADGA